MKHLLFIKSGNLTPKQLSVTQSMAYYIAQSRTGKIIVTVQSQALSINAPAPSIGTGVIR